MPWIFNPFTGNLDYYASGGGSGNSFTIWQPPAGTSPTASSSTDTMTLTSSDSSVTITGNSTTKTLDFKSAAGTTFLKLDGTNSPSAAVSWNSQDLTNLGNITYPSDGTKDIGVWNGNAAGNGSFRAGLNVGHSPDRQDSGIIECGDATNLMIQFGTINGLLPGVDAACSFRDKAMGASGELYGLGKKAGSAVFRFFKFAIAGGAYTEAMTIDGATGNVRVVGNLGVGNSASATIPGTIVKKIEIFDASGTSLGFIAVYDSIT